MATVPGLKQASTATPTRWPLASRDNLKQQTRVQGCKCIYIAVSGLAAVMLALALLPRFELHATTAFILSGFLLALGLSFLGGLYNVIKRQLLQPLSQLHQWANDIGAGDLAARLPAVEHGDTQDLITDINKISDTLQGLSLDMEAQVRQQTAHIKHKSRSLEILYDVAASINSSRDLDDLLTRFLHTLKEVVHARAATVRLLTNDNRMRMVASIGLSDEVVIREQFMPAHQCLCGQAATDGVILSDSNVHKCDRLVGTPFFKQDDVEMIAVPLQYRGRTLGVYNLFVDHANRLDTDYDSELLVSIGRHLGMAIEKSSVDEEANRLTIIEERTRIAHELHDSLAQTLASLRFQVRVLDETLHRGDESALWAELERIENSLDEAYTELRGLIDHFRAPIDRRGFMPAIEKVVERFRNESKIQIFLQKEWGGPALPEDMEIQVLRIVQEALCNVRKHSKAHTVRVLLRGQDDGQYRVLVEDDGTGMEPLTTDGAPGEHVGLLIMEERARRLGGKIRFESEPGEGTRIQLTFPAPTKVSKPIVSETPLPLPTVGKANS
ncbi:MAG: GAF domain-containing protein [Gammaproteobacteria bacterium]|nr:GAF domain-containing protein [Gammaproteobacteria bacterium]